MAAPADIADFRELARRRLPHMLFEYIDSGSYCEDTLRRNVSDFASLALAQRVLRDASHLNLETELFGQRMAAPVMLAPVGFSGMYARRGEVQAARAAKASSLPFCLSSLSICGFEEVASGSRSVPWFQLYMIRDREFMLSLLDRVRTAGARVLVFTVDLPTPGARYRDARSGMQDAGLRGLFRQGWQGARRPQWLWDVYVQGRPHTFSHFEDAMAPGKRSLGDYWRWVGANFDPSVTWHDIDWIRRTWQGPIIIKGILDPEDARLALEHGADGIIVSNHGGRQLDSARSTISVLPQVVDTIGARIPVLMDGGIRSGLDVLKALALGAKGVMIGRAWAYALAADGERGVARMLNNLVAELRTAMVLSGCPDLSQASRAMIDRHRG